jgi:hypothetical protein
VTDAEAPPDPNATTSERRRFERLRPSIPDRYGALVQRVRKARLGGDVDELEQTCRALLNCAQARPMRAPLIRDAFTQLHQTLAWLADDADDICLIGCDTCQHPPMAQGAPPACSWGTSRTMLFRKHRGTLDDLSWR